MRQETSKKLFKYWNSLRGTRPAPERGEIEPSDIRDILGDTFILEVSTQMRVISFRLAGTRLCAAYGRELKGLGFLALWQEDDNFAVAKAVSDVYRDNIPVLFDYVASTEESRFVEYEAILLPLAPAADGNARILGVAAPRKSPYWLGAEPLVANHLRKVRDIETPIEAPSMQAPLQAPLSVSGDVFQASTQARQPRRVAHLTVLDGGRE